MSCQVVATPRVWPQGVVYRSSRIFKSRKRRIPWGNNHLRCVSWVTKIMGKTRGGGGFTLIMVHVSLKNKKERKKICRKELYVV